ncbi:MAG TPA: chemotaxis response regulator protein-glutamate methylesterase [Stellaceae bacterium]|nr:chemotaxis response regulator protein-glutamate methylesterase [Stellaceae bacterium]
MSLALATAEVVHPIRVMVVDDSAVIRGLVARTLEAEGDIKIVSSVGDGRAAVAAIERNPVDVVVLDIEMPVMDGLTAIPLLMKARPGIKILMASTLTRKNAQITLRALAAGAADFLLKPSAVREILGPVSFNRDLLTKVRELGARARRAFREPLPNGRLAPPPENPNRIPLRPSVLRAPEVIAIGSSTGGPQALLQVMKALGPTVRVPILITQHMPPTFTAILAAQIGRQCGLPTVEGRDGESARAGNVYVAPGNFHMTIDAGHVIRLNQGAQENYCRPSVDPMLRSVVEVYRSRVLAVMLTGMGHDGLAGCQAVVQAGGAVIAQDEATSVVWGMPGAVAKAGLCMAVLPLAEIGPRLRPYASGEG